MIITLKNSEDATYTICHGHAYAGLTGYWIGPVGERTIEREWDIRTVRPIRSPHEIPLRNQLRVSHYPLTAYTHCDTMAAAELLTDTLADLLPAGATHLEITYGSTIKIYNPAILQRLIVTQHGNSVTAQYLFQVTQPQTQPTP